MRKYTIESGLISVDEAFREFIFEKKVDQLAPATIKYYEENGKYIKDFMGGDTCINIVHKSIQYEYKEYLQDVTNRNPSSINTALVALRSFLNWANDKGYCERVKISKIRTDLREKEIFSLDELRALTQYPQSNRVVEWRNWISCCILIATGMRGASLRVLKVSDVDLINKKMRVFNTKAKKYYTVEIQASLEKYLMDYLKKCPKRANDYLVSNIEGTQMKQRNLNKTIEEYCIKRGVEKSGVHIFRHTYATLYIQSGGDIYKLCADLDHSDIRVTMVYLRSRPNYVDEHNPLSLMNG